MEGQINQDYTGKYIKINTFYTLIIKIFIIIVLYFVYFS
jgi:hypothetical protein